MLFSSVNGFPAGFTFYPEDSKMLTTRIHGVTSHKKAVFIVLVSLILDFVSCDFGQCH
jgi:hypothetical protein